CESCTDLIGLDDVCRNIRSLIYYDPGNAVYYAVADEPLPASRQARDHHQFVTLEFSREHLQKQLVQNESDLEADIRRIIFGEKNKKVVARTKPMTIKKRGVVPTLAEPRAPKAPQLFWYKTKPWNLRGHLL